MLKLAKPYEAELADKWMSTVDDPKYKYFHYNDHARLAPEIRMSNWADLQYVSVNSENEVIGYFDAEVGRASRNVMSLSILAFEENNVFSLDLMRFFDLLFLERNIRKVCFSVVIGNPAEQFYDRFIQKFDGQIVGVRREQVILMDGEYYDDKLYEIFREDYIRNRRNVKKRQHT